MDNKNANYLSGLNTFRFFAAFLVIISHGHKSLVKLQVTNNDKISIFNKGADGVEFFFVLSGFLITYLLILEIKKTSTISIKAFYLRRVFRIWPLYFIIVILGILLLVILFPLLYHKPYFEFSIWKWIILFICFLPNLATQLYPMGMLHPLWSIGVEEQFYLFWAPLVKKFKNKLLSVIVIFILLTSFWQIIIESNWLHFNDVWNGFFTFQKFYAMAIGSLAGYILANKKETYKNSIFNNKIVQLVIYTFIIIHLCITIPYNFTFAYKFFLAFLFSFIILNTVIQEKSIFNLEKKPFIFLGTISYGLYMYHMAIDYLLRILFSKINLVAINSTMVIILYQVFLLALTIVVATISFKFVEAYFLKLKFKFSHS
jgi:peptidoglycan/LPS O-acetylase OafA/YrhL